MKVFFVSLGCDKNLVDSERMLSDLAEDGFVLTDAEEEAEVIVINTCCFIDSAKEESIDSILEMAKMKEEGNCRSLIVAGCMAERYKEEILKEMPEVDAILGTGEIRRLPEVIFHSLGEDAALLPKADAEASSGVSSYGLPENPSQKSTKDASKEASLGRILTTGGHYEYLKIAEGCDKNCTYCVIPSVRGPYRSMPMDKILSEARALAQRGVRELILVAQETTRYGVDLYGTKMLHILLQELAAIEGIHWIRLLYCYPEEIYPELIRVMKEEKKICHYLDLPVQHCSDQILRKMGRRTKKAELEEKIALLRREIPDIVLRTTLISGFPGETKEDHAELLDFVRRMKFDRLGVFTYSQEEGTPAARMKDQLPEEIKEERRGELMEVQRLVSQENNKNKIGEIKEVFVEGFAGEENAYVGRTYADAPNVDGYFFLTTEEVLHSGDFVRARVTGGLDYDLIGEVVREGEAE